MIAALALLLAVVLGPAAGAQAATWDNEDEMRTALNRDSFVADPGFGELWERTELIEAHADFYMGRGFGNLLTWGPEPQQITPADATLWASCGPGITPGIESGTCPDDVTPLFFKQIGNALEDTTITALAYGGAFIAMACGNFSHVPENGPPPPILTGVKFEDLDADGTRDAGEPGVEDWTIKLYQGTRELAQTTTDASGRYRFVLDANAMLITSQSFYVREVGQDDWVQSTSNPADVHVPFGIDSSARTFEAGDFGNYRPATIEGVKFDDHNVNGIRDAGEALLEGWTITLSGGRSAPREVVTGPDGKYTFAGLIPDEYTVGEELQDHWRQTAPLPDTTHTLTVRSGETASRDFGNVCLGHVEVRVRDISNDQAVTGLDARIEQISVPGILANYPPLPRSTTVSGTFADLLPGTYRVIVFLPVGYVTPDRDLLVVDGRLAVVKEITVKECQTTIVPIDVTPASNGKVTGGMRMDVPGGFATAGFVFMTRQGKAEGSLEYVDHATGLNLHTNVIYTVFVKDRTALITGKVLVGDTWHAFHLTLVDNGEPGTEDRFELVVTTGYITGRNQSIDGGNDQIHPPEHA